MRAYAIDEFGQPGTIRDLPDPQPEEGQVRVLVSVAGINPFDNAVINGYAKDYMEHRFPLVPCGDFAGSVDAVGPGVEGFSEGDPVLGSVGKMVMGEGTLAEFATASTGARATARTSGFSRRTDERSGSGRACGLTGASLRASARVSRRPPA